MPLNVDDLTRDNDSWVFRTSTLEFRVLADDPTSQFPLLQSLIDGSDSIVNAAIAHTTSSPYASDISDSNGISAHCVHVHSDASYCVWFRLNEIPHRYLAVKFVGDSPVDVYCDHP